MEPIGVLIGENENSKVYYNEESKKLILTNSDGQIIKEVSEDKSDEIFKAADILIDVIGITGGVAMEKLVKGGLKSYNYTFDGAYNVIGFGIGVVDDTSGENPEPLYQAILSQGVAAAAYTINTAGVAFLAANAFNPVGLVIGGTVLLLASNLGGAFIDSIIDEIIENMRDADLSDFEMEERVLPPYLTGEKDFKTVKEIYDNASTAQVIRRDPLVLDLDGDGLEIDPLGNGAHFDLDRNGFAKETDW